MPRKAAPASPASAPPAPQRASASAAPSAACAVTASSPLGAPAAAALCRLPGEATEGAPRPSASPSAAAASEVRPSDRSWSGLWGASAPGAAMAGMARSGSAAPPLPWLPETHTPACLQLCMLASMPCGGTVGRGSAAHGDSTALPGAVSACLTCAQAAAGRAGRLAAADSAAGVRAVTHVRSRCAGARAAGVRAVRHVCSRCAGARAACGRIVDVAPARSGRPRGRCLAIPSRAGRRGGRAASGAPALECASGALGGLCEEARPRRRGRGSSCGRGGRARMGAPALGGPRRGGTHLARPALERGALTYCLEAGHAAPATEQARRPWIMRERACTLKHLACKRLRCVECNVTPFHMAL